MLKETHINLHMFSNLSQDSRVECQETQIGSHLYLDQFRQSYHPLQGFSNKELPYHGPGKMIRYEGHIHIQLIWPSE